MDLNQYILALKARRKAFITVLAVTVFTAIVVALVIPKRYDATATILIDARDEQTMAPARMSPRERAGYIFTQMELIASGKVAHKVVRDLKLAGQPGVREDWEKDTGGVGSIEEWLATNLLEKLKVDSGASNILIVKYSANDPKKAADIANAFAKAYLDVALELRTEPSREAGQWFDEQLKAAEGRLKEQAEVLGPNHPTYQRTVAEVEGLKERLNAEANKVVTGLGNAVQQTQKRVEELQTALKDQSERIMKMRESRVDMAVLTRDLDNAQRAYDGALGRAIAVKVDSKVRQTNLAMLTPAVEPLKPAVPKVGLISALSVVIGLLLAAGMVYLLEVLDRRVRSRTDLESRLAVPSLGLLSRWTPAGGRLLPSPNSPMRNTHALPRPW